MTQIPNAIIPADPMRGAIDPAVKPEQVAWVDPETIRVLQERGRWTTAILCDVPAANATMPLYAAPASKQEG